MSYAGTTKTDVLGLVEEWLARKKAENISTLVVTDRFAERINMPKNKGDTLRLRRSLHYAKKTTALSVGEQPASPTKIHKTTYVEKQLAVYGDHIELPTPEVEETALINAAMEVKDEQDDQIIDTLDFLNMQVICDDLFPWRADNDTDYQKAGTCTSAGTTTTAVCTTFTEADDYYNGARICFTAQTVNFGLQRQLNATAGWVNSTHTFSWATDDARALRAATSTSDTFWVAVGTGITADKKLTLPRLLKIRRQLLLNKGNPWQAGTHGKNSAPVWVFLVNPYVHEDAYLDDDLKQKFLHQGDKEYVSGAINRVLGLDFVLTTEGYRENVSGVYSATGAVHVCPVFGKNAYATTRLNGAGRSPDGIVMEIKPDPSPITRYHTLAWSVYRTCMVKSGLAGMRIMFGASS